GGHTDGDHVGTPPAPARLAGCRFARRPDRPVGRPRRARLPGSRGQRPVGRGFVRVVPFARQGGPGCPHLRLGGAGSRRVAGGTLLVITSARRQHLLAWLGVGSLVVQTALWAGPGALASLGVVGSVLWVGVSYALSRSLDKAGRDARTYALAEREAAEWRAAQEAHVHERQYRLEQTSRMALPMLRQIVEVGGNLTTGQRQECLYLEGAIRDEIRGRKLLNDQVREQVMIARRHGKVVNL